MSDDDCGCCEGIGTATPEPLDNAPGQTALSYRVGTHGTFLSTMMARLSALQAETGTFGRAGRAGDATCLGESHRTFMLGGEPDAATALLDGWACIADVLTFYQERIANEGYLRTATEERSVIELGRLTGYEPRPGVASSVYLAFTVQDGFDGEIPAKTRTQSMPRPGQTAQMFETSEAIDARAEWNAMRARRRATGRYIRREYIAMEQDHDATTGEPGAPRLIPTRRIEIFLEGTSQNVQTGDVVIVEVGTTSSPDAQRVFRVTNSWPHEEREHTTLRLVPIDGDWIRGGEWDVPPPEAAVDPFAVPTLSVATVSMARARRSLTDLLRAGTTEQDVDANPDPETILALVAPDMPELRTHLLSLIRTLAPEAAPRAHVMRVKAQVFGHGAAQTLTVDTTTTKSGDNTTTTSTTTPAELDAANDEQSNVVYLDGEHAAIRPGSWLVMRAPPVGGPTGMLTTMVFEAVNLDVQSRHAYGISGKATRVDLSGDWWSPSSIVNNENEAADITPIRRTIVYAQAEPLSLVGEWLDDDVGGTSIDLDSIVDELDGDRLLFVEGVRADLPGTIKVQAAELVRVADARPVFVSAPKKPVQRPFGKEAEPTVRAAPYTRITLTAPLRYRYRRGSVIVRGNVAHATHGETRDEILGSGDATVPEQRFTLRQGPRTWVSAPTPTGIASTLEVRVSGILWPEVPSYAIPGPRAEVVRTRTRGDRKDEIRGGTGRRGARFPTGVENLTARYRVGIGAGGNVDAKLISALVTRPLGVREVVNPMRSSGGADPDGRDEIRARIPIAARGSDRLVSISDHGDFALNFAGIDKASARYVAGDGTGGATVEIVIAGDEMVAIDEGSDLLRNLRIAFGRYGDPLLRPVVRVARPVPMVLQAGVRIDPRHEWANVEPVLRERIYQRQGWEARGIGEPAHLSVVLEILQAVDGVRSIDVDVFGPLRRAEPRRGPPPAGSPMQVIGERLVERMLGLRERITEADRRRWSFAAGPDEILYFARNAPATIVFSEIAP